MNAFDLGDGPPIEAGPQNIARAQLLVRTLKLATPELGHRAQAEKDGPGSKTWEQIAGEFGTNVETLRVARQAAGLGVADTGPRSPESKALDSDDHEAEPDVETEIEAEHSGIDTPFADRPAEDDLPYEPPPQESQEREMEPAPACGAESVDELLRRLVRLLEGYLGEWPPERCDEFADHLDKISGKARRKAKRWRNTA